MAVGVCLRMVLQPVSDVVSEKYALVSVALHVVSRSRRCSRSIPREEGLGNGNGHIIAVALDIDTWS